MPQNLKHSRRSQCVPGCSTVLLLLLTLGQPFASQASCSAYDAAKAGSDAGYNAAKQAADSWAQREQDTTDALSNCLGDISTTIVMPQFPDLTGILNQIEQKVCSAAQSAIDDYIPDTIDPWEDLPVPTDSTTIPVTATAHPAPAPRPATASPGPAGAPPASSTPSAGVSFNLN